MIAPQPVRTLEQINADIEAAAQACASNRKRDFWKGLGTKKENFYQDCKKNITAQHQGEIDQARAYENNINQQVDSEYTAQLGGGLQKSTMYILAAAGALLLIILVLFMD